MKIHDFERHSRDIERIVDFIFEWFALHTTMEDKKIAEFITLN